MSKLSNLPAAPRALLPASVAISASWTGELGDFWNDPKRWDGVEPHKIFFWTVRRPDMIDVRGAATNHADFLNARPDATNRSEAI